MLNDIVLDAYLELVKISIGTSKGEFDFSKLSEEDWRNVFLESQKQSTLVMCFDALKGIKNRPSDAIYNKWFLLAAANIKKNINVATGQQKLVELLDANEVPYVILKGLSSAQYYPDSNVRALGDVDFLVPKELVDTTKNLLIDNSYILDNDLSAIHYEFSFNNVRFELHKTIAGVPNNKYGKNFLDEITDIFRDREYVDSFAKPSDYHHCIVIFLHKIHHMLHNGIGIRHLCDWACFVEKTKEDDFWESKFIPLTKKTGTFNFMCGVTFASVELLGIDVPNWCTYKSNDMVATIISEINSNGNFGRKNDKRASLLMTRKDSGKSSFFSKVLVMIKALNKTNHIVCPAMKKLPILYPFVMIYRIARYLVLMCVGKRPSLKETSKYADERSEVFSKYQLYMLDE